MRASHRSLRRCSACLILLFVTLLPATARAAWLQGTSKHFIVYSEGSAKQLTDFTEKLEKFDYLLRTMTGTVASDAERPVIIYMLDSEAEVQALAHDPNIAGFYTTSDRNGYAVVARERKQNKFDLDAQEILFHEYAHHFMLRYFPAAYPAWYVEGFAEFYSVVNFPKDGSIEFGNIPMVRVPQLVTMPLYPLAKLFANDTDQLTRSDGSQYYGTAWLLTHYFRYNKSRLSEFERYLRDVVKGAADVSPDTHFTGGAKALEKELRAYMRGKIYKSVLTPQELPQISVTVSQLDDARAGLIMVDLELMHGVKKDGLQKFASGARALCAKFPASAYAQAVLADVEVSAGNDAAAMGAADKAIALDPKFARALSTKAELMMEKARESDASEDWQAALALIIRANRADTEDPVPLAQFYRYKSMHDGKVSDLAFDGLYKVYDMLPQNPEYRFMMAGGLAERQRFDQAIAVLNPVAFSPHGSDMREAALHLRAEFLKAKEHGDSVKEDPESLAEKAKQAE